MEGKAVDSFGRLYYKGGKAVTVCTVLIAIAALTGMRYMPCLCAGGSNYLCGKGVTRCGNGGILINVAAGTGVKRIAILCTSRCDNTILERMDMIARCRNDLLGAQTVSKSVPNRVTWLPPPRPEGRGEMGRCLGGGLSPLF